MPRSIVFNSDEAKATIRAWFDRFRARLPVPADDALVETSLGRTHALIAGPKDAAPLVLLHGALASSAHALAELGPLLRTRRVYALDIIGQSVMSADRRLDLAGDEYGRWVAEAVAALGIERYDL
jgi:2-hydroxy-6-oxonona-2,4-dienedioate hydrolase